MHAPTIQELQNFDKEKPIYIETSNDENKILMISEQRIDKNNDRQYQFTIAQRPD